MTATSSGWENDLKYRADIDGLRALAVIPVVIYHAFPKLLTGGFLGVDIFFVISGYLITQILLKSNSKGTFVIKDFYVRRIKRIFPALITVIIATLITGTLVMFGDEFRNLGKHVGGSVLFISNLILWQETGYFDPLAKTKPLLHLWSLAIEEQFYMLWPIILFLMWKVRQSLLPVLLVLIALSFGLNLYLLEIGNPAAAFFNPLSRAWELLLGALLAYAGMQRWITSERLSGSTADALSVTALISVTAAFALAKEGNDVPGWWAFVTVMSTVVLITTQKSWLNRKMLSSRFAVNVGLISYPLYLWHWPILVMAPLLGLTSSSAKVTLVILSVLASIATYLLVERPIRFGRNFRHPVRKLVTGFLALGLTGAAVYATNGGPNIALRAGERAAFMAYFNYEPPGQPYFRTIDVEANYRLDCDFYDLPAFRAGRATHLPRTADSSCFRPQLPGNPTLEIWGDSHAQQFYAGLKAVLGSQWNILVNASSGCRPDHALTDSSLDYCQRSNWTALETIRRYKPEVVLIAQAEGHDADHMLILIRMAIQAGAGHVIVAGPVPHWTPSLPATIVRRLWVKTPELTSVGIDSATMALNDHLRLRLGGSRGYTYFDVISTLCEDRACRTRVGPDRKLDITTWDYGHLTPKASIFVAQAGLKQLVSASSAK
ncbi:acyltransferase family protein [Deinococcus ficus]|uniref:acyltransferase family protein n=1 Tax=Deinococcus ficus TaxID=317577 RepID=UPI0003FD733C|nr:acyltransferase family protein [Deinococcus ficus]